MRVHIEVLLLCVTCTYLWPERAAACSCNGEAIYRSEPEADARDVALNQAITIEGVYVADSIVFEDEAGQVVEFDATLGPTPSCPGTSAELVPKAPLRANTTYVIRVQPILSDSDLPDNIRTLTFTTGSRALPDRDLEPPKALASTISNAPPSAFGCGSGEFMTCVGVDDFEDVEVLARRGDQIIMRWMLLDGDGAFLFEVAPDCMEFRRRSPTGKRSAVVAICGPQLAERPFRPTDLRQQVLQCRNGKVGADADPVPAAAGGGSSAVPAPIAGSSGAGGSVALPAPATATNPASSAAGCSVTANNRSWGNTSFFALVALVFALRRRPPVSTTANWPWG